MNYSIFCLETHKTLVATTFDSMTEALNARKDLNLQTKAYIAYTDLSFHKGSIAFTNNIDQAEENWTDKEWMEDAKFITQEEYDQH